MSDYDRGAYTPPHDEPLAFDARSPERRRPLPMTLIASGVILVVLTGAVALFYQSGVRGANEPPRAVGQSLGKIKSAPGVDEAKPVDDTQTMDVYVADKAGAQQPGAPRFTNGPEQPMARHAEGQAGIIPTQPTAPVQAAALAPVKTTAATAPATTPVKVATIAPKAIKAPAALKAQTPHAIQPEPPAALVEAGLLPAPVKAPAATAKAGGASVQIGAFSSTAIADQELAKVRAAYAKYTSGKGKHVEPVAKDGGTLYRTAFTGFSKAEAQAFCAALAAAGHSCMVK